MSFYTLRIKHNTRIDERTGDVMEKMTSGLISRWGRLVGGCGRGLKRRLSLKRVVYYVKINHDAEQVILLLTAHRNIFINYVNACGRWAEGTPSVIDISSQPMRILLHVSRRPLDAHHMSQATRGGGRDFSADWRSKIDGRVSLRETERVRGISEAPFGEHCECNFTIYRMHARVTAAFELHHLFCFLSTECLHSPLFPLACVIIS